MNKYEEKELDKIITIEDNMYLVDNSTIFNDGHGDDNYLNLYEFRNTDKEYKLTDKGYILKQNKKDWWFYTKDIAKGTARGTAKLTEGVGSLALATLEKMNLVSEGTVNDFSNFYQENIYDNEGFFRLTEPETLAGGFAEGISQFLIPGLGAYGAMAKIFKARGVWPFIYRALTAEAITVGAAQVPGDPNFASFLSNFLDIDKTKADSLAKEFYIYITTPENVEGGYDADAVFNDKFKAIIGDAPLGPVGETLVPLFKMFAKGIRKLRGKDEVIADIEKNIVNAPDNEVFDIDNPPPGVIEDKMPQKGDVDYEEPASGGLSKDRDAMDDLNKDIAAQVEEVDNSNINLSGGSAMNPEGPLAKEIDEGTFSYKSELEGTEKFDTIAIMNSIEPVIKGTGKNNKVKIEDITNHFDQAPKLDIKNPDDFKLMVDQGVKEVTYQLDQKVTGAGWYDKDIKIAMEKLDEINPKFKGNDEIKDLVVFFTAIASPGQNVGMDFKVAAQIADIYLDTGKFPTTNPNSLRNADDVMVKLGKAEIGEEKGWTQRSHLKGQIEFVQKYVDANGLKSFLEFLNTPTTRRELNELRKSYDMKPIAGALDKEIYGADMFGPKVSKFMQSLMGTSDEAVPDIWFTRGFNRKSGHVYTIKKDGVKASADQPRNLTERKIMDNYINEIQIQLENMIGTKLNARDTQAVLWYFEQGLYTKLGVKSEPKSYADAAKTIIERKANDIEGGFSQSNVGNVESKKSNSKKNNTSLEDNSTLVNEGVE